MDEIGQTFEVKATNQTKLWNFAFIFFIVMVVSLIGIMLDQGHKGIYAGLLILDLICFAALTMGLGRIVTDDKTISLLTDKLVIIGEETIDIPLSDIKDYRIVWLKGVFVDITLDNGEIIKLKANGNFTNTEGMDAFATAFNDRMSRLIKTGQVTARRKKTHYESVWYLAFLIIITVVFVALTLGFLVNRHQLPPNRLWIYYGFLIAAWVGYYKTKGKYGDS